MMTRSRTAIDTILFDLGNVLIYWDPRHVYDQLIPNEAERERFLTEVCNHDWNIQMDAGRPWADGIAELVERHPEQAHLIRAYRERWEEMLGGPNPGTVDILWKLRGKYRLFAITNWSADTFAIARPQFDFLKWFADIVVSGEIGLIKPDPAIFRHATQRWGLDPARSLFIDDALANVKGAARLGFATHHFRNHVMLQDQLEDWGLL